MRQTAYKGWAVFSRSGNSEWPMITTIRATRRDAINAWTDEMGKFRVSDPAALMKKRIADGSIRVGKVSVIARNEATP